MAKPRTSREDYKLTAEMITDMKRNILMDKMSRKDEVAHYQAMMNMQEQFRKHYAKDNPKFDEVLFGHACRENLFDDDVPWARESAFMPQGEYRQESMICNPDISRAVTNSECFIVGSRVWKRDQKLSKETGRKRYAKGSYQK